VIMPMWSSAILNQNKSGPSDDGQSMTTRPESPLILCPQCGQPREVGARIAELEAALKRARKDLRQWLGLGPSYYSAETIQIIDTALGTR